jgi:NitT/TauT family transport system ATP-binding protein
MILEIKNVGHMFRGVNVLHNVNLQIARGQFVAMIGKSGCGKSTLLKAILGTHPPKTGTIFANQREVIGPSRDVGIVYQKYTLFPHLTVEKNVAEGLRLDQTSIPFRFFRYFTWRKLRQKHLEQTNTMLHQVGLLPAADLYPSSLSGGMQQRVAICQALIMKPQILLLDEPFGALDQHTREELQDILLGLYAINVAAIKHGAPPPYTVILVTHELREAFLLADRVIGLSRKWKRGDESGEKNGATIIFDKAAPIYVPGDKKDYNRIASLTDLCYKVAIADDGMLYDPLDNQTFWSDLGEGIGTGVSTMPVNSER